MKKKIYSFDVEKYLLTNVRIKNNKIFRSKFWPEFPQVTPSGLFDAEK